MGMGQEVGKRRNCAVHLLTLFTRICACVCARLRVCLYMRVQEGECRIANVNNGESEHMFSVSIL